MGGAGQRPGLGLLVEGSTEPDRAGPRDQLVDELVVDRLLDQEPGTGRADLAGVQEHRGQREVERRLTVGVGEDDVGVLAAELERDPLHRARGRGHQGPAGGQAAGERDQVDARVGGQGRTGRGARPEHEVADPRRQSGLLQEAHQVDRGVRGQLAGLEHEGVAGGQAGRDLPGDLEERVVPRRDQGADADRFVHDPADDVGVSGVHHPTRLLCGHPPVVAYDGDHVGDVVLALDQALAGVQGLGAGQVGRVALQQVRQSEQQVAAFAGRGRRPGSLVEGPVGRLDRGQCVVGRGLVDGADQRAVRRAVDLATAALTRGRPRAVDVQLRHDPGSIPAHGVARTATSRLPRNPLR